MKPKRHHSASYTITGWGELEHYKLKFFSPAEVEARVNAHLERIILNLNQSRTLEEIENPVSASPHADGETKYEDDPIKGANPSRSQLETEIES